MGFVKENCPRHFGQNDGGILLLPDDMISDKVMELIEQASI